MFSFASNWFIFASVTGIQYSTVGLPAFSIPQTQEIFLHSSASRQEPNPMQALTDWLPAAVTSGSKAARSWKLLIFIQCVSQE